MSIDGIILGCLMILETLIMGYLLLNFIYQVIRRRYGIKIVKNMESTITDSQNSNENNSNITNTQSPSIEMVNSNTKTLTKEENTKEITKESPTPIKNIENKQETTNNKKIERNNKHKKRQKQTCQLNPFFEVSQIKYFFSIFINVFL